MYNDHKGSIYAGKRKLKSFEIFCDEELLILKKIGNNQNIVRFFSTCLCQTEHISVIIMELCDGNLEEYIQNKQIIPLPQMDSKTELTSTPARRYFTGEILDILHQATKGLSAIIYDAYTSIKKKKKKYITKGLQFLHENEIIHRDVKPSNVFLNRTGVNETIAKLGGFGYSIQLSEKWTSVVKEEFPPRKKSSDSDMYEASESCSYRGVYSKPSDIFALGILIHYAITGGKHPFTIETEIKEKKVPSFSELRKLRFNTTITEEPTITAVDMIRRMISHEAKYRLIAEEVLCHPIFWKDKKKLQFLLKIHESVKNIKWDSPLTPVILKDLRQYDGGLLNDNELGELKNFTLCEEQIFKDHKYFYDGENYKIKENKRVWIYLKNITNVTALLKALRDKIAHVCDWPSNEPNQFEIDFEVTDDSYNPRKFLEVFLSQCPQLLIHLYEKYRNTGLAVEFYL